MFEKLPPNEKVFEAWSALASDRAKIDGSSDEARGEARVVSSNGEKTYHVAWENNLYASDDNATRWQKYPGYPVLAVLMIQGKLPYNSELAQYFKDVDWNALNAKAKRNYAEALKKAFAELRLPPEIVALCESEAEKTMDVLKSLDMRVCRYGKRRERE